MKKIIIARTAKVKPRILLKPIFSCMKISAAVEENTKLRRNIAQLICANPWVRLCNIRVKAANEKTAPMILYMISALLILIPVCTSKIIKTVLVKNGAQIRRYERIGIRTCRARLLMLSLMPIRMRADRAYNIERGIIPSSYDINMIKSSILFFVSLNYPCQFR